MSRSVLANSRIEKRKNTGEIGKNQISLEKRGEVFGSHSE